MTRLAGRAIVVTGATGIAAAAVHRFLAEGAAVFTISIDPDDDWDFPEERDGFIRYAQRRAFGPSTQSLVDAAEALVAVTDVGTDLLGGGGEDALDGPVLGEEVAQVDLDGQIRFHRRACTLQDAVRPVVGLDTWELAQPGVGIEEPLLRAATPEEAVRMALEACEN